MQLGNRIFPYPILNNRKELSEFKNDINFELHISLAQNGEIIKTRNKAILKDVYFSLNDIDLLKLYNEGKIACSLIVESSSSIYRQKFKLTENPQTYEIDLNKLKDDVYLSAYCYATCDIENYSSKNFNEDYKEYAFNITKYDIVAADDGVKFVIDRDLEEDNKVSSIFVIAKSLNNINTISYDMKSDKIYIYLPPKEHDYYNSLKSTSDYNDMFFSMLAIPVLTSCFSELKYYHKNEGTDLAMIVENYRWFDSVLKSYKKEKSVDLSEDEFDSLQSLELAQIVFNYSSINGIDKLYNMVSNVALGDDSDV